MASNSHVADTEPFDNWYAWEHEEKSRHRHDDDFDCGCYNDF